MEGRTLPDRPLFAETGLNLNGTPPSFEGSDLAYPSILFSLKVDPLDHTLYLKRSLEDRMVTAKERQVRTANYKLIYTPVPKGVMFRLYDVRSDPENLHDLYERKELRTEAERLERLLFDWMLSAPGYGLDRRLHLVRRYNFFE